MKKVIFIGPRGLKGAIPATGSSIKNYYIYNYFKDNNIDCIGIATDKWRKRPWVILQIIYTLLIHPHATVILSTSFASAYLFLKLISRLINPSNIIYWVIGGALADKITTHNFDKQVYQRLSKIIVEGTRMKRELADIGIENVIVVPNFKKIDYLPTIKAHADSQGKCKFVFLSRIRPEKGCDLILEACRELNRIGLGDKYDVTFYGPIENGYDDNFHQQLASLDNVRYNGFLDLRNLHNYDELASYSIFLFPTYWSTEGFPGIIIDAMISGLPIVASDWNLNCDLIQNDKTGILIPPKDVESLIKAMKHCILNQDKYLCMKEECQRSAMHFDIKRVLSKELLASLNILS